MQNKCKGVIAIFLLPNEIENFLLTANNLKRNSAFLDGSIEFQVDITFCISNEMVNWRETKISRDFLIRWIQDICSTYFNWCVCNLFVEYSDAIIGCVSQRRNSLNRHSQADFFIWLDSDIFFPDTALVTMYNGFRMLRTAGCLDFILTPQIVRQWDTTWDPIVNSKFIDKPINYQKSADVYQDVLAMEPSYRLLELQGFKFAGGWFTLLSSELLKKVKLPIALGHYGLEDTYVMCCSAYMLQKGIAVKQFFIENLLVSELNHQNANSIIRECVKIWDRKEELRKIAESNFEYCMNSFIESQQSDKISQ